MRTNGVTQVSGGLYGLQTSGSSTPIAANFFDNSSDPRGGYPLQLTRSAFLLSGLLGSSAPTDTASFQDLYNGKFPDATGGVIYTPVAERASDIAVSAAPEPSAWALLMAGVAMVGARGLRPRWRARCEAWGA